jgi:hypothetical protein
MPHATDSQHHSHAKTCHMLAPAQALLWDQCGGLNSPAQANAPQPGLCCQAGSACMYINPW